MGLLVVSHASRQTAAMVTGDIGQKYDVLRFGQYAEPFVRVECEVLLSWGILKCGDPFGDTGSWSSLLLVSSLATSIS